MGPLNASLDYLRNIVRHAMHYIARVLNRISSGKLSPNSVTVIGLLAHVPIAHLIATRHNRWAAALLVIFGLFDVLDGELARFQKSSSAVGMFLDSATDRVKEILLYCGMMAFLIQGPVTSTALVVLVAALGVSILITYLNAWGEAVLASTSDKNRTINKTFRGGLLGFDARMVLIIIGLATGQIITMLCVILILGIVTVIQRFTNIIERLRDVQD